MSTLTALERRLLEEFFGMSGGYVLDFSNKTFDEFMEEHSEKNLLAAEYLTGGESKANRLRAFWKTTEDDLTGKVILALIEYAVGCYPEKATNAAKCREIALRLIGTQSIAVKNLNAVVEKMDMPHLKKEIDRAHNAIERDTNSAVGTAKDFLESVCKTILVERSIVLPDNPELQPLVTEVRKALPLVPDGLEESSVKRLLGQLSGITSSIAELRNDHGSGHGRHGQTKPLPKRHARLAVGAAATLAVFLLETHLETKTSDSPVTTDRISPAA
jgi:hypothetical protein